jgi:GNAT superfamily N-acetyltransferase
MQPREWTRGEFVISTDRSRLDVEAVHRFLSTESYWSPGIPLEVVRRAIEHSLPFGVYRGGQQVGFARVVTDFTTFAYLADVFILESQRGQGLSKWLMEAILSHPDLQGLRRWMLATRDAHGLYAQHGFKPLKAPERFMEKHDPDVYRRGSR